MDQSTTLIRRSGEPFVTAVATAISAGSMPTTAAGWVTFTASLFVAIMAALGK